MEDNKRFDTIFKYILYVEGGYTDDKYDTGGKTKYGIIEVEARKYGYLGNMRDLTLNIAKNIYFQKYFKRNRLDEINSSKVALSIFDWTVNSGRYGLTKAQLTLNELGFDLEVDGKFGNKTIQALNEVDVDKFLSVYHDKQRQFYQNIVRNRPTQKVFLKGWLNRVNKKENYIENMEV